ncbi:MAG: hypothetical protein ABH863_05830 [Candidatus Micrarchaeota archaeon]
MSEAISDLTRTHFSALPFINEKKLRKEYDIAYAKRSKLMGVEEKAAAKRKESAQSKFPWFWKKR